NLQATTEEMERSSFTRDEWKLRYFNDMEARDKEMSDLKASLQEAEESNRISRMEMEEIRKESRLLKMELNELQEREPGMDPEMETELMELKEQLSLMQTELMRSKQAAYQKDQELQRIAALEEELEAAKAALEAEKLAQQQISKAPQPDYLEQLRTAQK